MQRIPFVCMALSALAACAPVAPIVPAERPETVVPERTQWLVFLALEA